MISSLIFSHGPKSSSRAGGCVLALERASEKQSIPSGGFGHMRGKKMLEQVFVMVLRVVLMVIALISLEGMMIYNIRGGDKLG